MELKIGKTLAKLIKEQDMTLKTLAQNTGVSASTLSEWKSNRKPKDPTQLQKVASELGVTIHFLLFGVEDSQEPIQKILKEEFFTGTFEITLKRVKIQD